MPAVMAGSFDHVVSNPPYHHKAGTRPRHAARAMAHMGAETDLRDWVKAAVWAAKPRGRISFICRADRASELITMFDAAGAGETVLFPLVVEADESGKPSDYPAAQSCGWPRCCAARTCCA
jgi:tRNA1(Val) A37 N6-methylase TrmN6